MKISIVEWVHSQNILTFYHCLNWNQSSTFDFEVAKLQEKNGMKFEEMKIPVKTLKEIYENSQILKNQTLHFVKIDVEGFEKEVLQGIDFSNFKPWIFIIESIQPGSEKPSYNKWEDLLLKNNYEFVMSEGFNRFYLRKDKKELYKKFLSLNDLETKYDIYKSWGRHIESSYSFKIGKCITRPLRPIYNF